MKIPVKIVRQVGQNFQPQIVFVTRPEDFAALSAYFIEEKIFTFVPNEGAYDTKFRYFLMDLPVEDDNVKNQHES